MQKPVRKILKGIRPFNRFLFKSCYYHQLLACYAHFGADENVLLLNYLPVYLFQPERPFFLMEDVKMFGEEEQERMSGIRLVRKRRYEDFTAEAVASVDRGEPVIVGVDTYYLPYRKDNYRRIHYPHFLLLYGYDLPNRSFVLNEHMFQNSMRYARIEQSVRVMGNAHRAYAERHFRSGSGIIQVTRSGRPEAPVVPEEYAARYAAEGEALDKSIAALREALRFLTDSLADRETFGRNCSALVNSIATVRNRKTAQNWQFQTVYRCEALDEKLARILNIYVFLCGMLVRTDMTGTLTDAVRRTVESHTRELFELECEVHEFVRSGGRF